MKEKETTTMSKHFALSAEKRERAGKGVARTLRREKKIPAVVYGDAKEPEIIQMAAKEITLEYQKGSLFTNLCDLTIDGKKQLVLVRDVQIHPVTDRVEHVDFIRVTPKTTITVDVPVHFLNEDKCPGIKNGGSLTVVRHELELVCKATEIPKGVDIDLSAFETSPSPRLPHHVSFWKKKTPPQPRRQKPPQPPSPKQKQKKATKPKKRNKVREDWRIGKLEG